MSRGPVRPENEPARFRTGGLRPGEWLDLGLIALAAIYLAVTGLDLAGRGWHASADRVADGQVWLLLTSAFDIAAGLDLAQWLLLASLTAAVIFRLGPRLWWAVSVAGHVIAALVSYLAIELAVLLGSTSAEISAGQADYGISIVVAAGFGALTASGFLERRRRGGDARPSDRAAIAVGLLGLAGMAAVSLGWYDIQHLIGYAIGFFMTRYLVNRRVWGIGGEGRFERPR